VELLHVEIDLGTDPEIEEKVNQLIGWPLLGKYPDDSYFDLEIRLDWSPEKQFKEKKGCSIW
jgi:hypothetical protein